MIDLAEPELELLEEAWEGWLAVQSIEGLTIRDVYEAGFIHGMQSARELG